MKLKNERPRKVLIKGIPIDFDIADVKGELSALGYNVHRVSQLKNFRTKLPMPIYLGDVFVNDPFKHIFEMRNLMGFFVKAEAYKFKGAKQCTVIDRAGIKCANCCENHTANFRGCIRNPKNRKNSIVQTFRNSNQGYQSQTS